MNSVNLTGRLTRDPELRSSAAGDDVCAMRLAADGPGDQQTTFVDVTAFAALGRSCGEHLSQGRPVAVAGRLAYSEWEDADGRRRSKHEVIARQVDFLGSAPRADGQEAS